MTPEPGVKPSWSPADAPLCVDLDGTLVRTDTLPESMLLSVRRRFWAALLAPLHLLRGRAAFKARLAALAVPDAAWLPYNDALLSDLRRRKADGRILVLATAADRAVAEAVARHVGLFDRVIASDGRTNLKGRVKAEVLEREYGAGGFDYVGDSSADVPVWLVARRALLARAAPHLQKRLAASGKEVHYTYADAPHFTLRSLPGAMRLHQWLKNALVFVPLVSSQNVFDARLFGLSWLAFLVFGLSASSVYLINDLLDLSSDRRHPRKRNRPFASGAAPLWAGLALAPALFALSAALAAAFLPPMFMLALLGYICLTFAYSAYLKQIVLVDVHVLALLYTVRMLAGAFAIASEVSFWLLAFSIFLFLSLALVKRFSELQEAFDAGVVWIAGRGYKSSDLRLLMSLGTASGYVAVLVFALYLDSERVQQLYAHPMLLWLLCPLLLYWIGRMWIQAERANIKDDPLVFAARDRVTLGLAVIGAAVLLAAASPGEWWSL